CYDGGTLFSPDGKRLTFRRFSPDGHSAEVYTIGVDGTDEKRITNMKAMSWAPFYHPTGDYLIFASNKYGHANFELFIVDVQGRRDPVRVTEWDGFDGLPVFTPDGRKLVWTHADKGTEGQLYEADFNDAEARELLSLPAATPVPAPIMAWIDYLTQPKFAGRMTGSPQEPEYLGTIAEHMAGIGLKPVGGNYMQAFEFTDGVRLGVKNQAQLKGSGTSTALPVDVDWIPTSDSKLGPTPEAQIVFAGYGIVAPSDQGQPAYDAYEGLDVKGRWALVFDGIPNEISNERRYHLNFYSRIAHKALAARQAGAIGLLVIDDANSSKPLALKFEGRGAQAALPILRLSPRIADQLLTFTGQSREDWTEKLSQGEVAGATVKAWMLKARVDLQFTRNRAHNVVGILRVPGATKSVVIGAHGDHLGQGQTGHSLAKGDQRGLAHPGADDNASGVAAVLSMAKDITQKYQARQITLRQNIVFAIWSGEEVGILGSTDFLQKNPVGPISAYINLDMVGRLRDHLIVQGVGSAQDWTTWLEPVAQRAPVSIKLQSDPYLPTDALSFYLKRIPAISFFTGAHPEYHTPADKPELINSAGLLAVAGVVQDLAVELAGEANPALRYQKVESTDRGNGGGRGFRLYLGTIPDYSSETQAGVKISGTSKNSPAEKAGLKPGDVIVELGGIKINTMNDYVYCLQALKADAPAKMRVLRAGAETTLEIVPKLAH
ncbi:MAG: M28 family peptidase, partial [Bdellovibrionales bacterium]